jgi:hypothetical protein
VWEDGGGNPASYPILKLVKRSYLLSRVPTKFGRPLSATA